MIIGIGVDIVDVNRIARLLDRFGYRFLRKILVEREFKAELSERRLAAYLAKQFAAKEAVSKALGTGMRAGVGFRSIKVLRDPYGKPYVELSGQAAEQAEKLGACFIHISLSDERDFAIAFATASSIT